MARAALEHLKLDKIVFMPTGAPRYRTPAAASGEHRVAMLRLALQENPSYEIDARELAPGASGYTVDSLRELRLELGADAVLWLLMGADQYAKLDTWHRPADVRKMARVAVVGRPGVSLDKRVPLIPMEPMKISASDIRGRVARGEDIAALVPAPVANYIERNGLYR
jgi:nicotinate-nucleotide adenylyltransferase